MTRSLILALVFLGSAPPAFAGWQALGTVPTPADAGEYPFDYALGADGTAAVAWCSVTPQGVRAEATIRSRNAKGFGKVKSFATLPHRYYGGCAQVDVEVAADGTVALLWSHGDLRLKLATKPAGKPWSRAAIVAEDAGGGASDFALGPDAGVWVVWSGNQNRVIRVRHQPKGKSLGPVDTFTPPAGSSITGYLPDEPSGLIAVAGDGTAILTFLEGFGPFNRLVGKAALRPAGQPWGPARVVTPICPGQTCSYVSFSVTSTAADGHAALISRLWPSHSDSTDLYLTERLPNKGFGTPQKIVSASSPLRGSSLAVGAMGKIYVAYSTPTESRLWARRPGKPPTDQRWPTYPPAALGADDWLILTETKTDAAGDFIQATVRSPKAKEGKTARLSGDSPARHQTLVRGPSGRAIAFWWEHPAGEAPHLEAAYHKP